MESPGVLSYLLIDFFSQLRSTRFHAQLGALLEGLMILIHMVEGASMHIPFIIFRSVYVESFGATTIYYATENQEEIII